MITHGKCVCKHIRPPYFAIRCESSPSNQDRECNFSGVIFSRKCFAEVPNRSVDSSTKESVSGRNEIAFDEIFLVSCIWLRQPLCLSLHRCNRRECELKSVQQWIHDSSICCIRMASHAEKMWALQAQLFGSQTVGG